MRRLLLLSLTSSLLACAATVAAHRCRRRRRPRRWQTGELTDAGPDAGADAGPDAGTVVVPSNPYCTALQLPTVAFIPGSSGLYRGDIAPDFTLPLYGDAGNWTFSGAFTGCDSYVFITEEQTVSSIDPTPLAISTDWSGLIASPNPSNVHYFFISVNPNAATAAKLDAEVAQQIAAALAKSPNASVWQSKLHVVAGPARSLGHPIGPLDDVARASRASPSTGGRFTAAWASSPTSPASTRRRRLTPAGAISETWPTPPTRRST